MHTFVSRCFFEMQIESSGILSAVVMVAMAMDDKPELSTVIIIIKYKTTSQHCSPAPL
jgi:hypothetical protein